MATHRFRLLLLLVVLMSAGVAESVLEEGFRYRQEEEEELEPADAGGYRKYVVMLGRPSHGEVVIKDGASEEDIVAAHRAWHESYLPSSLTSLGEPRLIRSYHTGLHGFYARLTEEELKVVSGKPGFISATPDSFCYLDEF